jgi:hypothetical protein
MFLDVFPAWHANFVICTCSQHWTICRNDQVPEGVDGARLNSFNPSALQELGAY